MKLTAWRVVGRASPQKSGSGPEDFIRVAMLPVLPFDPANRCAASPHSPPQVPSRHRPAYPDAQRLRPHPELAGDRAHRSPIGGALPTMPSPFVPLALVPSAGSYSVLPSPHPLKEMGPPGNPGSSLISH